jgi:hypothetical protein
MASKAKTKKVAAPSRAAVHPHAALRREMQNEKRAHQAVARFRTSSKGFRGVFTGHFPKKMEEIETLAFHLAQFEAKIPNTLEAVRLARYPGAGNRNPKRMALGLCENLSVLKTHLSKSIGALEAIANGAARK